MTSTCINTNCHAGWEVTSSGARPCACQSASIKNKLLENSGIPSRYRHCTIENYQVGGAETLVGTATKAHATSQNAALRISRHFIENFPYLERGLLFKGLCGVGKTHLSAAICREVIIRYHIPARFIDSHELIAELERNNKFDLTPYRQTSLLVFDELGGTRSTPWVQDMIYGLVNKRYTEMRLTIFTTNHEDITDRIGARLHSRLHEMCKTVTIQGEDYRKQNQEG